MFELNDLDIILQKMKKKGKFSEFIHSAFNHKIESNINEYHIQNIEGDVVLYIYERRQTHNLYTLEFTNGNCDVYMDKMFYKRALVNVVYVNKCIELYKENINDKIINFCMAMNATNIEEQKTILRKILSEELIDIMYK